MDKGGLDIDPRGLIFESYRIDGIGAKECRTIFLDWALGVPESADMTAYLNQLIAHYGTRTPDHPMTGILREGLQKCASPAARRGGRRRR